MRYYAGIGSRKTPPEILALMERFGEHMCDLGFGLSSGHATGADQAFERGARRSEHYDGHNQRIYLPWNGFERAWHNPADGYHDARRYRSTYALAERRAIIARGTTRGLSPDILPMHTRNVFQILGHTLQDRVVAVVYYARPIGRSGRVSGGTNTAVQIALQHRVPTMANLYLERDVERVLKFIDKAA